MSLLPPLASPATAEHHAPVPSKTSAPLREAARDLHEQFLTQMLKESGLADAFAGREASGEAAALVDVTFGAIARDMADAQPALTEKLYAALRRQSS